MTKSNSFPNNNPLFKAKSLSTLLITKTIVIPIITLHLVSLQSPTMLILIQHLQPQPTHNLLTNGYGLNPALRQQPISRKALNPYTMFIVTVSLHLLGLSILLLPKP